MQEFNSLLVALLPRMQRYACKICKNKADAEDLVQSACERALSRAHQFELGTKFDAWVFRILQNVWIDVMRKRNNHVEVSLDDGEPIDAYLGSDTSVRRIEAGIELTQVVKALSHIAPEQSVALRLVVFESYSYKEAAEISSVPLGTIMSRVSNAREALRPSFQELAAA
jgi:RNA polymerase sigma-70 factor, ECF subfamily